MANEKNLIPLSKRTKSEQREIAKKGGKKSGKVRRAKKTMRETIEILLNLPINVGKCADIKKISSIIDISGQNVTAMQGVILAQIKKALKGDTAALVFLRDTVGEKPTNANVQDDETKLDRLLGEIETECDT